MPKGASRAQGKLLQQALSRGPQRKVILTPWGAGMIQGGPPPVPSVPGLYAV